MAESDSGYQVGPDRPPLHSRFRKGQSGNPGGRSTKSLPALLADALNETVSVTIDGRRRTNPAGWPRRTRRSCSTSSRGCSGRSYRRSKKRRRPLILGVHLSFMAGTMPRQSGSAFASVMRGVADTSIPSGPRGRTCSVCLQPTD